jgi:alkylhydroperoxidase/carboxymuconolactone decarboxylase family protein YurZ
MSWSDPITVVEPGFFRTDLLDAHNVRWVSKVIEDYAAEGTAEAMWSPYNGTQPNDPAKLGDALVKIASMQSPPKVFIAGRDALEVITPTIEERLREARANKTLSESTAGRSDSGGHATRTVTSQTQRNSNAQSFVGHIMKRLYLTENAVKNHQELFPNHESKLQKTDPEFIELFDNWAFDEVIRQSKLDTKTRVRLILASTIASQALGEYKVMVGAALNVGLTPVEIKEILYQVPYVGVAKVFDFLHATNEVLQNNGVSLPLEGQSTTTKLAAQLEVFQNCLSLSLFKKVFRQTHIGAEAVHLRRTRTVDLA